MIKDNTTSEDLKQTRFSLKSVLIVVAWIVVPTCTVAALIFNPPWIESAIIFLFAIAILLGIAANIADTGGKVPTATRVVVNALVGAIAGAVPSLAFYETIMEQGNGLGGLLAVAILGFGTGLGLIVGGIAGGFGIGIRVVSTAGVAKVVTAACMGSALVTITVWLQIGNDEFTVVGVSVLGMLAGMWLSTDRASDSSHR
ncbi:unnamed protein product [marine sediment metagenome]|uniref:Uncharacterized protein n=1 Tax=marine sediment metagenome TaxID=412755 RepID=X1SSW6_9ZZZZ